MTTVAELMSPVEHTVVSTHLLIDAVNLLHASGAAVLVVDPVGHTLGMLTDEDLRSIAVEQAGGWDQRVCADICPSEAEFLRMDQPLAVLNGSQPVGILYPEAVFLWCLEQPHLNSAPTIPAPGTVYARSGLSRFFPLEVSNADPYWSSSTTVGTLGALDSVPRGR